MEPVLDGKADGVERDPLLITAVLGPSLAAGVVDQNATMASAAAAKKWPRSFQRRTRLLGLPQGADVPGRGQPGHERPGHTRHLD